jgi:septum formation protein|tara:strand:+ start:409 stop:1038 length:630 start_codon:yes stop_codon:yes gene_type:complete
MMNKQLVLASQSPRRKALLSQLGYQFICQPADIDESVFDDEAAIEYVVRMAKEKAQVIANRVKPSINQVVLGADTCVVIDSKILAKPVDVADCLTILKILSAEKHQVLTAIAVTDGEIMRVELITTDVYFKALTTAEIIAYWQSGEPQDKAGAYGIQGIGGQFVRRIEGSYSAVVGLPLYETSELLATFGLYSAIQQGQDVKIGEQDAR